MNCNEPQNWVFTFGVGQKHGGHYVVFYGTFGEARNQMFNKYGSDWAFQYSEEEWEESKKRNPHLNHETLLEE